MAREWQVERLQRTVPHLTVGSSRSSGFSRAIKQKHLWPIQVTTSFAAELTNWPAKATSANFLTRN